MISNKFSKLVRKIEKTKKKFNKFDKKVRKGIYLRFDVDISIKNALQISTFLKRKKIAGNFFFQPNNEIYNIFNKDNKKIINQIKKDGHLIGLHIDEKFFSINEKDILTTINFFRENGYRFSNVISFHRPSNRVLKKKYKKIVNTYEEKFFNKDIYISDSAKNVFFEKRIDNFLRQDKKTIQILLHPVWWNNIRNTKNIYLVIKKNAFQNLNNYLIDNFPKVFSKYILKK